MASNKLALRDAKKLPDNWPAPDFHAVQALRDAWDLTRPHTREANAEFRRLVKNVERSIRAAHLDVILTANRAAWLVETERRKRTRKCCGNAAYRAFEIVSATRNAARFGAVLDAPTENNSIR